MQISQTVEHENFVLLDVHVTHWAKIQYPTKIWLINNRTRLLGHVYYLFIYYYYFLFLGGSKIQDATKIWLMNDRTRLLGHSRSYFVCVQWGGGDIGLNLLFGAEFFFTRIYVILNISADFTVLEFL